MKVYTFRGGEKIEVVHKGGALDVVYAMGEHHIDRLNGYKATRRDGTSKTHETYEDAKEWLNKGE